MISIETDRRNIEVRQPAPGQRHNVETIYVPHRFAVKGGITYAEWLAAEYARHSRLAEMMKRKAVA